MDAHDENEALQLAVENRDAAYSNYQVVTHWDMAREAKDHYNEARELHQKYTKFINESPHLNSTPCPAPTYAPLDRICGFHTRDELVHSLYVYELNQTGLPTLEMRIRDAQNELALANKTIDILNNGLQNAPDGPAKNCANRLLKSVQKKRTNNMKSTSR